MSMAHEKEVLKSENLTDLLNGLLGLISEAARQDRKSVV